MYIVSAEGPEPNPVEAMQKDTTGSYHLNKLDFFN